LSRQGQGSFLPLPKEKMIVHSEGYIPQTICIECVDGNIMVLNNVRMVTFNYTKPTHPEPLRFSQLDPRWKNDPLGASAQTIRAYGCAMTCAAMVYSQADPLITPQSFNAVLTKRGGFNYVNGGEAHLAWDRLPDIFPGLEWKGRADWDRRLTSAELATVKAKIDNAPLVLWVDFRPKTLKMDSHFVLAIGYRQGITDYGNDIKIIDPADGQEAWLLQRYATEGQDLERAIWGYRELVVK
jgi:hypothetical protein